jgi:hypothetical protein
MLLDRYRQLLTAYVDGELTSRQRRHVARLLHRSAEARQLLQQLQEDARALRGLPRPQLPADISSEVIRTIIERRLTPGQRRVARVSAPTSWVGPLASWAAAAAVLLVLGVASYLYFTASLSHSEKADLAKREGDQPSSSSVPDSPPPSTVPERKPVRRNDDTPPSAGPDRSNPPAPPTVVQHAEEKPKKPDTASPPTQSGDSVLTDRLEMFRYSKVEDILPTIVEVKHLEQEAVRGKLLSELRKDTSFRIELPCKNGTKAFERVRGAAAALNVGLVIDKQAQARLKHPDWKTNYVVYAENLTPEEVVRLTQLLGAEDRKIARKPVDGQFDRLVLTRLTASDHKELTTLMGLDPTVTDPAPESKSGVDPRKPLSDLTAEQVGQALAGQGGSRRLEAGKGASKLPEQTALVLAFNPVRPTPDSAEIKHFLDKRKPRKPDTIRLLLVLRG